MTLDKKLGLSDDNEAWRNRFPHFNTDEAFQSFKEDHQWLHDDFQFNEAEKDDHVKLLNHFAEYGKYEEEELPPTDRTLQDLLTVTNRDLVLPIDLLKAFGEKRQEIKKYMAENRAQPPSPAKPLNELLANPEDISIQEKPYKKFGNLSIPARLADEFVRLCNEVDNEIPGLAWRTVADLVEGPPRVMEGTQYIAFGRYRIPAKFEEDIRKQYEALESYGIPELTEFARRSLAVLVAGGPAKPTALHNNPMGAPYSVTMIESDLHKDGCQATTANYLPWEYKLQFYYDPTALMICGPGKTDRKPPLIYRLHEEMHLTNEILNPAATMVRQLTSDEDFTDHEERVVIARENQLSLLIGLTTRNSHAGLGNLRCNGPGSTQVGLRMSSDDGPFQIIGLHKTTGEIISIADPNKNELVIQTTSGSHVTYDLGDVLETMCLHKSTQNGDPYEEARGRLEAAHARKDPITIEIAPGQLPTYINTREKIRELFGQEEQAQAKVDWVNPQGEPVSLEPHDDVLTLQAGSESVSLDVFNSSSARTAATWRQRGMEEVAVQPLSDSTWALRKGNHTTFVDLDDTSDIERVNQSSHIEVRRLDDRNACIRVEDRWAIVEFRGDKPSVVAASSGTVQSTEDHHAIVRFIEDPNYMAKEASPSQYIYGVPFRQNANNLMLFQEHVRDPGFDPKPTGKILEVDPLQMNLVERQRAQATIKQIENNGMTSTMIDRKTKSMIMGFTLPITQQLADHQKNENKQNTNIGPDFGRRR